MSNLSEEEQEAIEVLESFEYREKTKQYNKLDLGDVRTSKIILNLIEKLQISLEACENSLIKERQERIKLNKVIDEILKWEGTSITLNKCFNCKDEDIECNECIKHCFYKKVEEENE